MSPPSASILTSPGASSVISVAPLLTKSNVVVPPSFIVTLAPSASNIISAVASKVILPPLSISAITGVVKVLFVKVSVVSLPTSVVVALGIVTVLSAVGSVAVRVVSKLSSVAPSKVKLAPVKEAPEIFGLVKVLFVSVCVAVAVITSKPPAVEPSWTLRVSLSVSTLTSPTAPVKLLF